MVVGNAWPAVPQNDVEGACEARLAVGSVADSEGWRCCRCRSRTMWRTSRKTALTPVPCAVQIRTSRRHVGILPFWTSSQLGIFLMPGQFASRIFARPSSFSVSLFLSALFYVVPLRRLSFITCCVKSVHLTRGALMLRQNAAPLVHPDFVCRPGLREIPPDDGTTLCPPSISASETATL